MKFVFALIPLIFAVHSFSVPCGALERGQIVVIANKGAYHSVNLARYYMKKRRIDKDHLLVLHVTKKELCTREEYEQKIRKPIVEYLEKNDAYGNIQCLVLMYGMPLKIAPSAVTQKQRQEIQELKRERGKLEVRIKAFPDGEASGGKRKRLVSELKNVKERIRRLRKTHERASLDSELSLVLNGTYPLRGWLPNPFFLGYRGSGIKNFPKHVLLVSRLDGPSPEVVRRIIDDSINAENKGLKGVAYFDARWPLPQKKEGTAHLAGYKFYDFSIHKAAERLSRFGKLKVVINEKEELFQPGECPHAALYCGWYSLGNYIDAFQWIPGAIGYHIASSECVTLKGNSNLWCKRMLEKGAAATIGPTSEPYVQAFPIPDIFFGLLVQGHYSLAECYFLSLPFLSWQMVLIGDPLYRPFSFLLTSLSSQQLRMPLQE